MAIGHFTNAVESLQDPSLVYLVRLFQGQVFTRLNRFAEAEASFESALRLIPAAQSATEPALAGGAR